MMIVKVVFAEMNHAYDFKVDETQKIKQVAAEMAEMIAEKEHLNLSKDPGMFLLCRQNSQSVFLPESTLADNQVSYGDTLFLV